MVTESTVFSRHHFLTMSWLKRTNVWSEDFTTVLTTSRKCLRRLRAEISIPQRMSRVTSPPRDIVHAARGRQMEGRLFLHTVTERVVNPSTSETAFLDSRKARRVGESTCSRCEWEDDDASPTLFVVLALPSRILLTTGMNSAGFAAATRPFSAHRSQTVLQLFV